MWQNESSTLTRLAVFCRRKAHLALAAVATWSIQTLAVLTQVHVVCTLIHVWIRTEQCIINLLCMELTAHTHTVANIQLGFIKIVSAVLPEQENPSPLKPSLHVHL